MRVSAFDLAAWLVSNWWRLRWETSLAEARDRMSISGAALMSWEMSHKIGAAGNGYLWPDIEFSNSGDRVRIRARPTKPIFANSIRFLNAAEVYVPGPIFEAAIGDFVAAVVARVAALDCARTRDLTTAWRELGSEIGEPLVNIERAMEARMGYDPEEADPEMLAELLDAAEIVGWRASRHSLRFQGAGRSNNTGCFGKKATIAPHPCPSRSRGTGKPRCRNPVDQAVCHGAKAARGMVARRRPPRYECVGESVRSSCALDSAPSA